MLAPEIANAAVQVSTFFEVENGEGSCTWRLHHAKQGTKARRDLAKALAELAVRLRDPDGYPIWRGRADGSIVKTASDTARLDAFVGPALGSPRRPFPSDHVEASVAALVWFALTVTNDTASTLLYASEPQF